MKLELWMIVATGVTCAAGFGILAVLILSLDGQVKRLLRQVSALQNALEANLKTLLAEAPAPMTEPTVRPSLVAASPPLPPPPSPAVAVPKPPVIATATATVATATEDTTLAMRWTPERRLLVMRLAARGNPAEQIAAALRIPRQEIDLFIRLNGLDTAPVPAAGSGAELAAAAAGLTT